MKLPDGYVAGVAPKKATAMGGFGQCMLEKMGWEKGQGLGKAKQGRSSHIEVQFKDDKAGLGGKYTWDWERNYAADAFQQAVSKVGGFSGDSSDSDTSSSDSDDEDHLAVHMDGIAANTRDDELKLARELAKGNNLGRFGARAGKLARLREQEAKLAEMYGIAAAQPVAQSGRKRKTPDKKSKISGTSKKCKAVVIEVRGRDADQVCMPTGPPPPHPEEWWGHKLFTSAGWLGGMDNDQSVRKRKTFSSNTQEDIYNRLKEQERKGRQGMGKREIRVMGTKWEGSKKTFEDVGSDQSSADAVTVPVVHDSQAATGQVPLVGGDTRLMTVVKKCLDGRKKGKLKLEKLQGKVAEALGVKHSKAVAKLQKRIDSGALILRKGCVMLSV